MSDIIETIRKHIELLPHVPYYKGLCPFHEQDDDTPTLLVWPDKQFFRCMGLREGRRRRAVRGTDQGEVE